MRESEKEGAPIKAIDFGLAAFFVPGKTRSDLGTDGTPFYMSPETLRSESGPAADVWAVGVMAYQLLSGWFPFNDHANPHSPVMCTLSPQARLALGFGTSLAVQLQCAAFPSPARAGRPLP